PFPAGCARRERSTPSAIANRLGLPIRGRPRTLLKTTESRQEVENTPTVLPKHMDPVRSGAIFRLQRTHFAVISSPARSRGGSAVGSPQLAQVKTEEGNRQSPSPSAGAARSPGTRHSNHARFHDLCQTSPISTAVLQRLLAGPKLEPLPKPETEPIRPPQSPLPSSPQPPEAPASAVSLARSGDTAEQLFDAGLPADDDMKMPQPEAPEPAEEEVDFSTEDSDKVTAGPNVKTGLEPSSSGAVPTPATGVAAAMTADAAPAAPADAAAVAAVPVATGDDATASVAEQGAVTLTDWHLLVSVDAGTAEMVVRMGGRCDIAALTTGPVASRVGVREVRAEDGRTYLLKGPLAAASCAPLLPGRVAAAYRDGFPARWRMSLRRVFAASEAAAAVAAAPAPADLISVEDDSTDEAAASKTRELRRKRPRQPPSPSHAPPHRAAWVSSVPSALPPPGPEMSPPEEADESVDDEVAPAPPPPPPAAPSSHRPAVAVPPAAVAATAAGPPVESPPRAAARPSASAARRSARKSMPVLDWWRNQRLREDAGEEGGPAVVPGSTEDAPSAAPASAPAVAPRRKRQDLSKPRDKSAAAATATAGATRAAAAPLAAAAAAASAAATGAGGKAAAAAATTAGATKTRGKAARISFLELETPVWGEDEVQALFHAHMVVEPTAPDFWERVAKRMGTRTATDCQERWFERFEKPPPAAHKKTGGRGSGSGGGGGGGSSGGGGGGGKRP
ncbi:unnamed protein product, partial [Phaeothamnion confervicola]